MNAVEPCVLEPELKTKPEVKPTMHEVMHARALT